MAGELYSVGVIGGGAWGTALSIIANRAGSKVMLGTRNANVIASINERRTNEVYLPNIFIDPRIEASDDLSKVCRCDVLILAVPSHVLRSVCITVSDTLDRHVPVILASKGIERGSLMLMSEVAQTILSGNPVAVLSGPNFADEAARGLPTATSIACTQKEVWGKLTYAVGGRLFRPYMTKDIVGTQLGGAVKNVIAIACGIAIGKGLGENARAALVTRGFAEIARLVQARGGKYETLMGLSGIGDLMLTCGSPKSRNMSFGIALGQGADKDDMLMARGRGVTEGVIASESVYRLARKHQVDMPICESVYRILHEGAPIDQVIDSLLERPFTQE